MKLEQGEHQRIMLSILEKISVDSVLANNLGFKGGTACYFLYGLDRFSVDLDFDILNKDKEKEIKERIIKLLNEYGEVKTKTSIKLKYSEEFQALKIDLSGRYENNKLNTYEIKDIVSGVSLKVLKKEDIFAHKLVALTDRSANKMSDKKFVANRDLYDIYFFFKNNWRFNDDIIELQTKKEAKEYLIEARDFIEKYCSRSSILERLGELVDEEKRLWIKENLKNEVMKQLAIEIKVREMNKR
ncbi:MAG TPA: hypothetical protein ENJ27_00145 [Candidatus Moranbacteria bacterium]|nr:hypothetical protein [Candidatus Moranbacteria bacterium]